MGGGVVCVLTKIGAEDFESWEEGFSLRRETEFRNQIDFQRTSLFIYMEAVFEGGREKWKRGRFGFFFF